MTSPFYKLHQHLRTSPAYWAAKDVASAVGSVGNAVLSPATSVGPQVLRAAGQVGNFALKNPKLLGAGLATAAVAPILAEGFDHTQHRLEDDLMNAHHNPGRVITASLEDFLEKKANFGHVTGDLMSEDMLGAMHFGQPAAPGLLGQMGGAAGGKAMESLATGAGKGVAEAIVKALFGVIGSGAAGLKNMMVTDPKRRAILETIKRQDQIIADTLAHNPHGEQLVQEAYDTMVKVAPTLSTDINAVRSWLREAVIGGAGVNYATIKNLAEAERAVAGTRPQQ